MNVKTFHLALAMGLMLSCTSCTSPAGGAAEPTASHTVSVTVPTEMSAVQTIPTGEETMVVLSDSGVTVDGLAAASDPSGAVYVGADIVYYEAGHDETYGEGTEADEHTAGEAQAHTVVTITRPGTYLVSGTLSAGQLAIDLGEDAEEDPSAVVNLILDGVDITCTVAPAVIFYNVYECGSADAETATPTVDTRAAGANVILAGGSENYVDGSYVAKIYKEGTKKKLHKYDGAFYSKMSMNIGGSGALTITAENEGLDAELHLTINGGDIHITAQNDGINTNEDGVSVTTVNGGSLTINAGLGAEGDGIDSNGYLVINGGTVTTMANGTSGDGGIDSDMGIYLNGGTVIALGSRNDEADSASLQPYMELSFASTLPAGTTVLIQDKAGEERLNYTAEKEFATLTFTSPDLQNDETYFVYVNGTLQQFTGRDFGRGGGMGGPAGGMRPDGQMPENGETPPDGAAPGSQKERPEGDVLTPPSGAAEGAFPGRGGKGGAVETLDPSTEFTISSNTHSFSGITNSTI